MAIGSGNFTDSNGNSLTSQSNGTQQALDVGVNVAGVQIDPRVTRTLTSADQITVASSALPTGASTAANQTTANTSLASIDSKLTSPIQVITTTAKGALVDRSLSVSTTSVSLIPANVNRKYLMIQNLSNNKVYINFGSAATAGLGSIFLAAGGGSFSMEGEFLSTDQIFVIASANNSIVTAKEG